MNYTTVEQSKKLAEILPLESADMFMFNNVGESGKVDGTNTSVIFKEYFNPLAEAPEILPCWSLAALLAVLPSATLDSSDDHHYRLHCMERYTEWHDNPVDACVAIIKRLHELNLL